MCLFCIYYTTLQYTFFLSAAYSITAYSKDLLIYDVDVFNNLLSRCGVCVLSKQKQVECEYSIIYILYIIYIIIMCLDAYDMNPIHVHF